MINENKSVRDLKRMVLIGAIVALVSQLYWNLFVYNFRISSSVIVLPVLLMTLGKNLSTTMTCSVTAVIVFLFRLIAAVNGGADLITSAENLFPNAVFYFCYGIIFNAMILGEFGVIFIAVILFLFSFWIESGGTLYLRELTPHYDTGKGRIPSPDRPVPDFPHKPDLNGGKSLPDSFKKRRAREPLPPPVLNDYRLKE